MDIPIIRTFMFFIDNAIYGLIPQLYELLLWLADINLFDNEQLSMLVDRIYMLLGIFMLFKISFSLIQYIISPNSMGDQSKGMGKLVTNALVSVVLLVMTPWLFSFAMDLQSKILNSNVIGSLILGATISTEEGLNKDKTKEFQSMGKDVQFLMYSAFFSINKDAIGSCESSPILGSKQMAQNPTCLTDLETGMQNNPDISGNGITLGNFFKGIKTNEEGEQTPIDGRNFWAFNYLLWWEENNQYVINYLPLISAAAGLYVIFLLITFCIDIALRIIKLTFLQMIAPIAIISYIDPKESISQSKLKNWLMECGKTYISLFLRLATMFLVIKFIQIITTEVLGNLDGGYAADNTMNTFIYVFLILGAFAFAKQVPKMIEAIFNFKSSGEFSLNPFKSISQNAGATGLIAGAVGFGAGALGGAMQGYKESGGNIKGLGRGLVSGVGGGLTGAIGGAKNGLMSGGKGYIGKGMEQGGRVAWNMHDRAGTTFGSRVASGFAQRTGAPLPATINKERQELYKRSQDSFKGLTDRADKYAERYNPEYNEARANMEAHKKALEDMKKDNAKDPNKWDQATMERVEKEYRTAQGEFETQQAIARDKYLNSKEGREAEATTIEEINRINKEYKHYDGFDGKQKMSYEELEKHNKNIEQASSDFAHSDAVENDTKAEKSAERRAKRSWMSSQKR